LPESLRDERREKVVYHQHRWCVLSVVTNATALNIVNIHVVTNKMRVQRETI